MSYLRKFGFLLLILSLLIGPTSGLALAQDGADDGFRLLLPQVAVGGSEEAATLEYVVPAAEQSAALEHWSSFEAREAAQPMPLPEISQADLAEAEALPSVAGVPGSSSSGRPAADADKFAQIAYAGEWLRIDQDELAQALAELEAADAGDAIEPAEVDGTKSVYTTFATNYYAESWKQYPYRTVGKLYITNNGYCSASVISPNNILVTAAHCVYNRSTGKWYPGWTFAPASRNGAAPYGLWSAHHARILNGYASTGNIRYDVALIKLNTKWINSAYRPVSYYTGYLGRSWGYSYVQSLFAQGYPSNLGNGQYIYTCAAESFYYSTDILGMGCNMTYGSSGGPWFRVFHPYASGARNYVNAVVSGVPSGQPIGTTFFGPRFSTSNIVPLCNAEGC